VPKFDVYVTEQCERVYRGVEAEDEFAAADWVRDTDPASPEAINPEHGSCHIEVNAEPTGCRKCGADYPDGGDGYDGMCPTCADKAEESVRIECAYCGTTVEDPGDEAEAYYCPAHSEVTE